MLISNPWLSYLDPNHSLCTDTRESKTLTSLRMDFAIKSRFTILSLITCMAPSLPPRTPGSLASPCSSSSSRTVPSRASPGSRSSGSPPGGQGRARGQSPPELTVHYNVAHSLQLYVPWQALGVGAWVPGTSRSGLGFSGRSSPWAWGFCPVEGSVTISCR